MSQYSYVISRTQYTHVMIEAEDFFEADDKAKAMVKDNMLEWETHPETYRYDMIEIDDIVV